MYVSLQGNVERGKLQAELIDDAAALGGFYPQWDRLAIMNRRPFCGPAWMLAWWRHVAPVGAELRTVAVLDGNELCGIAPFYAVRGSLGITRYRLLASGTSSRLEPLSVPGVEQAVARVIADTLSSARPRSHCVAFDGIVPSSGWPELLVESWTRRRLKPWRGRVASAPVPALTLKGRTYDEWFKTRNSHFRSEIRRRRKRLEERGAVFRMAATLEDLDRMLGEAASLHHARWSWRGGSGVLNERVERMLSDAGRQLLAEGRFRLWTIEVNGRAISAQIFVAAGGEVTYWLGGFDEEWAKLAPSIQGVLAGIRHAWEVGDDRVVLGAGGQDYKYSFADEEETVEWINVVPRDLRYPLTRAQLARTSFKRRAMATLASALSPDVKRRIRALRRTRSRGTKAA